MRSPPSGETEYDVVRKGDLAHTRPTSKVRIIESCAVAYLGDFWNVSRIVGRRTNREDLAPNKKLGASVPFFLSLSCSEGVRNLHRVFCEHRSEHA